MPNEQLTLGFEPNHLQVRPTLISGSARSGTSIVSQCIGSLEKCFLDYEPEILFSLFAVQNTFTPEIFDLLFNTYVYEQFLAGTRTGRSFNCSDVDLSSIYRTKDRNNTNSILKGRYDTFAKEDWINEYIPIVKLPDITPSITNEFVSRNRINYVLTLRSANETVASILKKGWFADSRKLDFWPVKNCDGFSIPWFVPEDISKQWKTFSEKEKAVYYYILNTPTSVSSDTLVVRYHQFLQDPHQFIENFMRVAGVKQGFRTEELLRDVRPQKSTETANLLKNVRGWLQKKLAIAQEFVGRE